MKKQLVYLCVSVMVLSMAACGRRGNGQDNTSQSGPGQSSAVQESKSAENNGDGTETAGAENNDQAGEENESWSEEMTALREAVVSGLGEEYWPSMAMPQDMLEMSYGLTPDMYDDYMGEAPMISTHVDTLLVVKPAEGQADAVEEALQNYRTDLVENSMQYPMNVAKVQASTVARTGDYVCFVLLGGSMDGVDQDDEEARIAYCQEVNQRVLELIAGTAAR